MRISKFHQFRRKINLREIFISFRREYQTRLQKSYFSYIMMSTNTQNLPYSFRFTTIEHSIKYKVIFSSIPGRYHTFSKSSDEDNEIFILLSDNLFDSRCTHKISQTLFSNNLVCFFLLLLLLRRRKLKR